MNTMDTTTENLEEKKQATKRAAWKPGKPKPLFIAIAIAAILILAALFFSKGLLVAATVNGTPISRLAVIRELEKQGGKQTLEALIDKRLIESELDRNNIQVTDEEVEKEIKKIEAQLAGGESGSLDEVLAAQGMTRDRLREEIKIQKRLEKALGDKLVATDEEISTYIKNAQLTPPKDMPEEEFRKQVGEDLRQQKFQKEAQAWVANLNKTAAIKYYVNYEGSGI